MKFVPTLEQLERARRRLPNPTATSPRKMQMLMERLGPCREHCADCMILSIETITFELAAGGEPGRYEWRYIGAVRV